MSKVSGNSKAGIHNFIEGINNVTSYELKTENIINSM